MSSDEFIFELEEYIKSLWSFLPSPIIYVSTTGLILDVNDAFLNKFNKNRFEIINKKISDVIKELRVKQLKKYNDKELKLLINGKEFTFLITIKDYIDANNKRVGYFISLSDITKQQLTEELINAEKEKLRIILSSVGDGLFVINKDKKIILFNKAAEKITGYKASEVIGKKYDKFIKFYFENGKRNNFISKALKSNKKTTMGDRTLIKRKNGQWVYVADSASIINHRLFNGLVIVFRDVTEKIKAEKQLIESEFRYKSLFDNATELIQSVSTEGMIINVNKAWCKALGYTKEEALKLSINDYMDDSCKSDCLKMFRRVVKGESLSVIKAVFKRKNGDKLFVEGSATPIIENGKIVGTWGIFTDVTEIIKNRELLIEKEKTEAINQLKNDFFMRVSHELRHPLVAIVGYTSVMLEENPSDIQRKYLERILLSGQQLKKMINRIIELTSLQSGESRLELKRTDIKELINELIEEFATQAELKGIKLVKKLSRMSLMIDAKRMKEALRSMIDNAIQFTDDGVVEVELKRVKDKAVIIIKDTGAGMSEDELKELSGDKINPEIGTKKYTHLKLGFFLAKIIIELHKGEIKINSEKGKGSKITITLPIRRNP